MLGIQSALMDVLLQGTRFKPGAAKEKGLVDELVATREELVPAAKAWIKANPEASQNPWDADGYKMPGGTPSHPKLAAFLPAFPALLRKQTKGAVYPAQQAILSAAVEGAQVDFDTASRIESRYLTKLIVNQNSKNMIQAFFFDLQAINAGKLRPAGDPAVQGGQGRRPRRRDDGRRHRLLVRPRRHGGRAQGRRAGGTPRRARPTARSCSTRPSPAGKSTEEKKAELLAGSPRPRTRPTSPAATW